MSPSSCPYLFIQPVVVIPDVWDSIVQSGEIHNGLIPTPSEESNCQIHCCYFEYFYYWCFIYCAQVPLPTYLLLFFNLIHGDNDKEYDNDNSNHMVWSIL